MLTTPRIKDELLMWEEELAMSEHKVSSALDPFELAHWTHMSEYASQKILKLEKELYGAV